VLDNPEQGPKSAFSAGARRIGGRSMPRRFSARSAPIGIQNNNNRSFLRCFIPPLPVRPPEAETLRDRPVRSDSRRLSLLRRSSRRSRFASPGRYLASLIRASRILYSSGSSRPPERNLSIGPVPRDVTRGARTRYVSTLRAAASADRTAAPASRREDMRTPACFINAMSPKSPSQPRPRRSPTSRPGLDRLPCATPAPL